MSQARMVFLLAGLLACGVPGVNADPIEVNGSLDDWISGISLAGAYDLPAGSLVPTRPGVTYWIEDSVTGANGYVGPGYGGQNFDVEAAYSTWNSGTFYGAFVTGFDKAGQSGWAGSPPYRTGDLFLDLNYDTSPGWDLAIALSSHGTIQEGHVYTAPHGEVTLDWYTEPTDYINSVPALLTDNAEDVTGHFDVQYSYHEGVVGEVAYASTNTNLYSGSDHNVYEVSISGDGISSASSIRMHYTQECGNDLFDLNQDIVIPEPSLSLLALGGLIAGAFARLRKGKDDDGVA